jgi:hypothetical protein
MDADSNGVSARDHGVDVGAAQVLGPSGPQPGTAPLLPVTVWVPSPVDSDSLPASGSLESKNEVPASTKPNRSLGKTNSG